MSVVAAILEANPIMGEDLTQILRGLGHDVVFEKTLGGLDLETIVQCVEVLAVNVMNAADLEDLTERQSAIVEAFLLRRKTVLFVQPLFTKRRLVLPSYGGVFMDEDEIKEAIEDFMKIKTH